MLENYSKVLHIEALTMHEMINRQILPAIMQYSTEIAKGLEIKMQLSIPCTAEKKLAIKLGELAGEISDKRDAMEKAVLAAEEIECPVTQVQAYRNNVFSAMEALRAAVDIAEPLVDKAIWPYPCYGDILFSVK